MFGLSFMDLIVICFLTVAAVLLGQLARFLGLGLWK